MSFYSASTSKEDVQQSGGGKYINSSGIYPVNIIASFVSVGKKGSESVDLFVKYNDQDQVLYGNMRITNNDGKPNQIGAKVFNQLVIVAGLEEVDEPTEATLPIGKGGADKDVAVLDDLCDIDVILRVQMEYGEWNKKITEKKVIKAIYRATDMATAEEIVNDKDFGEGFNRDQKYIDNVTYKDGVTPERVAAWKESFKKKTKDTDTPAAKTGIKKKRFGK